MGQPPATSVSRATAPVILRERGALGSTPYAAAYLSPPSVVSRTASVTVCRGLFVRIDHDDEHRRTVLVTPDEGLVLIRVEQQR